jgi:hypothetical protein
MDWIDLAQDRNRWRALVNTAMNLRAPYNVRKFLSSHATDAFSRSTRLHGASWLMQNTLLIFALPSIFHKSFKIILPESKCLSSSSPSLLKTVFKTLTFLNSIFSIVHVSVSVA